MPGLLARTDAFGSHPDQWMRIDGDASADTCVCFVHGGYWRPRYTAELMEPLANRVASLGMAAVNIEYRREADAEAMQADVRTALRRAATLFPRAARVVVGHSAGGQLALVSADEADVMIALAPVTDLRGGYTAGIGSNAVADLLGASPLERPAAYDAATPRPSTVPTLLVHGVDDDRVPVSHSRGFADLARRTTAAVDYFEFAQLDHMLLIDPDAAHWPPAWAWMRQRLNARRKDLA
ncbi:MAG: dipeptidyl aminopeptidase/acylaminoacyl-peptidase [Microbacterium sp.]|nr:dipeptidyl aminopeptidase/acylaminoacyl-peptidase [Microbacterium sp.]